MKDSFNIFCYSKTFLESLLKIETQKLLFSIPKYETKILLEKKKTKQNYAKAFLESCSDNNTKKMADVCKNGTHA